MLKRDGKIKFLPGQCFCCHFVTAGSWQKRFGDFNMAGLQDCEVRTSLAPESAHKIANVVAQNGI